MEVANNNIQKSRSEEEDKAIATQEAQSQVMEVIKGDVSSESMRELIESG